MKRAFAILVLSSVLTMELALPAPSCFTSIAIADSESHPQRWSMSLMWTEAKLSS
jgi:hypothetical protein